MSNPVTDYSSFLKREAANAKPGFGWLMSMQKQSLPWVLALCALIALAWAFNGLPSWLVVGASVLTLVGWLFVNVVMLRGIIDAKDRLNG